MSIDCQRGTMTLKGVLIIGPNIDIQDENIWKLYKEPGYLMIGLSKKDFLSQLEKNLSPEARRDLTPEKFNSLYSKKIKSLLSPKSIKQRIREAGGVNSGTRFDICAHGTKEDKSRDGGSHYCELLNGKTHKTSEIFHLIKEVAGKNPVEVHLESCYGGAAAKKAKDHLPKGSILVCHGSEDKKLWALEAGYMLYDQIKKRQFKQLKSRVDPNILDLDYVLKKLPSGMGQKMTIGLGGEDKTYSFRPKKFDEKISKIESYQSMLQNYSDLIRLEASKMLEKSPQVQLRKQPRKVNERYLKQYLNQHFVGLCLNPSKTKKLMQILRKKDVVRQINFGGKMQRHAIEYAESQGNRELMNAIINAIAYQKRKINNRPKIPVINGRNKPRSKQSIIHPQNRDHAALASAKIRSAQIRESLSSHHRSQYHGYNEASAVKPPLAKTQTRG